jgi:hypothetical protein
MFPYELEHVCSYSARLASEVIGAVAEGIRVNFHITGGEVDGPKMRGILRPVGGDWFTLRSDGVGTLDVRATIETHDGALVYIAYTGVADAGADGHARFLSGNMPATVALRTVPRMHTAHPAYAWVNRCQFLSVGEVNFQTSVVSYDVYAVR